MERVGDKQVRLALPQPFLLFYGISRDVVVSARVHGWINPAAQAYALDYGFRPAAFNVPPAGLPPVSAAALRIPQTLVYYNVGGPIAPGPREAEYAYQYNWAAFAPVVQGNVVPHGSAEHTFTMPFLAPGASDDEPVLRLRWRATALVGQIVGSGTGVVGPYGLDLTVGATLAMPIVPGTVVITAPHATGVCTVRDWPWPTAVEASLCQTGRMIGDVSATVDSTINYETGRVAITFSAAILAAPNNILATFEHGGTRHPIDLRLNFAEPVL